MFNVFNVHIVLNFQCLKVLTLQHTEWSVMLRKRWESNTDVRLPATCHQAIPSLSPARWQLGMTSLNYRLIVCGGIRCKTLNSGQLF